MLALNIIAFIFQSVFILPYMDHRPCMGIKSQYTCAIPRDSSETLGLGKYCSLLLVSVDYKLVSVNNECHYIISLSGMIEVYILVLASALVQ